MPKEVSQKVAKKTLRDQSVAIIMETELEDVDTNSNIQENMKVQRKGHAAIAFAIDMDGNELQRIVGRSRTPKRLKALEPLNVPRFTSEMLAEKQKQLDNKSQMLEEKMKKAKLQREMQRQALIDKQKHQEEYAKRVREKAKKFKEIENQAADSRPWGYSADEGDSDQSSDPQEFVVRQRNVSPSGASSFDLRESENNEDFFDT